MKIISFVCIRCMSALLALAIVSGCSSGTDDEPASVINTGENNNQSETDTDSQNTGGQPGTGSSGNEQTINTELLDPGEDASEPSSGPEAEPMADQNRVLPDDIDLSNLNSNTGAIISLNGALSVVPVGDFNGDGLSDVMWDGVVSGESYDSREAGVMVMFGTSEIEEATEELVIPVTDRGFFIPDVSADHLHVSDNPVTGDYNGDGLDDIVVSVPRITSNTSEAAGRVFVINGGTVTNGDIVRVAELDGNTGFSLNGFFPQQKAGSEFSWIGDVNADGYDDLAVLSDRGQSPEFSNELFLVLGRADAFPANVDLSQEQSYGQRLKVGKVAEALQYCLQNVSVTESTDANNDGAADMALTYTLSPCDRSNDSVNTDVFAIYFGEAGKGLAADQINPLSGSDDGIQIIGISTAYSVGDINADSLTDYYIHSSDESAHYILISPDEALVGQQLLSDVPSEYLLPISITNQRPIASGDFNSDSNDDLIYAAAFNGIIRESALPIHTVYNQYQSFGFDEQYQFISDEQTTSLTWSTDDDPVWENLARGFSLADFNGDGLSDVVLGIRTGNTGISPVIVLFGY